MVDKKIIQIGGQVIRYNEPDAFGNIIAPDAFTIPLDDGREVELTHNGKVVEPLTDIPLVIREDEALAGIDGLDAVMLSDETWAKLMEAEAKGELEMELGSSFNGLHVSIVGFKSGEE